MGLDMNVPIEQTIALEKVNPITDSALPNTFGPGLTMLELVNKLLRVVNSAVTNDLAMSNNFTNLLAAFEALRGYIAEHGFGDGSITSDMIARYAVTRDKLANYAVDGSKINAAAILEQHLSQFCVATYAIKDNAVVQEKIANGHVTTEKLADSAVTTDKVADGAITENKLAPSAVNGSRIKDGTIGGQKLGSGCISAHHLSSGCVNADKLAEGCVSSDKIAKGAITSDKYAQWSVTGAALANQSVTSIKMVDGAVKTQNISDKAVTKAKLHDSLLNDIYKTPLVLYGMLDNENPEMYLNDPTYGDAALEAILTGRPILVRTPNAAMLGMTNAQLVSIDQYTAIFSPVLTYQLPNYENDYLYLFYLRDEKQTIPMSGVAGGGIQLPVYGQLKLKLSTKYNQCPLEPMTTSEYGSFLLGLTQS